MRTTVTIDDALYEKALDKRLSDLAERFGVAYQTKLHEGSALSKRMLPL